MRTKKNPTSSTAKKTDAGLQKGSGPSLPARPQPMTVGVFLATAPLSQQRGLQTLRMRTGLSDTELIRLLVATGLYVIGLDLPGEVEFKFLLKAAVGEEHLAYALKEGADINGPELVNIVAEREAEERVVRMPCLAAADVQAEA